MGKGNAGVLSLVTYPDLFIALTARRVNGASPIFFERVGLAELHCGPHGVDERELVKGVSSVVEIYERGVTGGRRSESDGAARLGVHVHDENAQVSKTSGGGERVGGRRRWAVLKKEGLARNFDV